MKYKKPKQLFIIGGGTSIQEGIKTNLWSKLKDKWTLGLNYSYKYFNSTFNMFVDRDFWQKQKELMKDLPLIIGKYHDKHSYTPNCITVQTGMQYERDLSKGVYKASLVGIFALSMAIYLLDEGEIFLCYDDKTEVFTNEGWKLFKDLNGDELILTRKSSGITEWCNITAKQRYYYNGSMYHLNTRGIDLLVTPEHKFCLNSLSDYSSKFCTFKPSEDGYIWRTIPEFTTTTRYYIPKLFKWIGKGNITLYWLKLLGWYITEGCVYKTKNDSGIIIYQTPNTLNYIEIKKIIKVCGFNPIKQGKRGWKISNKKLYKYFSQFGKSYNKFIPQYIKQLPSKYLKLLLKTLIKGDGHFSKNNKLYYFTTSKQLADDVQEIAYKCGYYAEIYWRKGRICKLSPNNKIGLPQWTVYINKSNKQGNCGKISTGNLKFNKKITQINYKGYVYDITVSKNHTLWVRRNNICVWSGNCGYDYGEDKNKPKDKDGRLMTHFYQGDTLHRGIGKVNYYNGTNRASKDFAPFSNEKKIKIYNVSIISKIPTFEKISYQKFYKLIDNKTYNQNMIRDYILNKMEGVK